VCITQNAFAYEVKVQPDISIDQNFTSSVNLYLASLRTIFDSTYTNDVVSVSYDQTIGGTLFGDVTLIGKNIILKGESFGDVRIIADTVTISGVVNKDLIIIARKTLISPEAIVNGDTLVLAQTVDAKGQFLGQSQITASQINISGSVVGITTLTGSKISFMSGSKILSDLSYFSPQRAIVESGVEFQKELNFNQIQSIGQNDIVKKIFFAFVSFWAIIKLTATLFVIFILTQLFRVFLQRIIDIVRVKKATLLVTGIVSSFTIPLLILILFGSVVLIPVSIIVAAVFVIMIILLPAMSAVITASLYQIYVQKQSKVTVDFKISALALVFLTFLGFVPYVGSISIYVMYIISFGAMTYYLYEQVRRKKINLQ
jgi:carbonic anhydrase/acetyltransferase-like protein (isoleucine patch superfamily)